MRVLNLQDEKVKIPAYFGGMDAICVQDLLVGLRVVVRGRVHLADDSVIDMAPELYKTVY